MFRRAGNGEQRLDEFRQLFARGRFCQRGGDILCGARDLVEPVGQVVALRHGQHHGVER